MRRCHETWCIWKPLDGSVCSGHNKRHDQDHLEPGGYLGAYPARECAGERMVIPLHKRRQHRNLDVWILCNRMKIDARWEKYPPIWKTLMEEATVLRSLCREKRRLSQDILVSNAWLWGAVGGGRFLVIQFFRSRTYPVVSTLQGILLHGSLWMLSIVGLTGG
jgi:hypothetical protein